MLRTPPSFKWPHGTIPAFASIMDIMPTFLDLAGAAHPVGSTDMGTYRGNAIHPMRGKSWVPYFSAGKITPGSFEGIYGETDWAGWELFGRAALRMGKWKIVCMPKQARGTGEWELFDLAKDPGETNDLSVKEPEVLEAMLKAWDE